MKPGASDSPMSEAERIEALAAAWFSKRDSGDWSELDRIQFEAWLNARTEHRIAFIRLNAGWKAAARLQALGAGVPPGVIPAPGSWGNDRFPGGKSAGISGVEIDREPPGDSAVPRRSRKLQFVSAAAAGICALAIGLYLLLDRSQGASYATSVGGLDTVGLADGSAVTLNTDTRIQVDLDAGERRIELERGEAFFAVAKDAARPFVVHVDGRRVIAVGTKFSVRRDGSEVRVVVTEGLVRLEQALGATALAAGAVARTAGNEVLVSEGRPAHAEQLLSWRDGFLSFEATPLAAAVDEFNRYNNRPIFIEDAAIADFQIGGNFRSNNPEAFLWLLETAFPIRIDRLEDRIVLHRR